MPQDLSGRERVYRTLRFQNPDRAPRDLWALPGISMFRQPELDAFLQRFPSDFLRPDITYGPGDRARGVPNDIGTYVDEWGCRFENVHRGVIGIVHEPIVRDWSDLETFRTPDEAAALAKLQIEVVQVTDTDAALARIAADPEAFDLVLSDWTRPEPLEGAPSAGIRLLRALRAHQRNIPVVYYHGSFDLERRQALHDLALAEGAYGEAVMPDALLGLVSGALGLH